VDQRHLFHAHEIEKLQTIRTYLSQAVLAENTITSYRYDWSIFSAFCNEISRPSLPASADTLGLYIAHVLDCGKTIKTARRRICAIAHYHRKAGFASPLSEEVRSLLIGARRQRTERPAQKEPLQVEQIRAIADVLRRRDTPAAARDLAILVTGFVSALRRSNIVALNLDDVEFTDQGVVLSIRKEKQDQEGIGRYVALPKGNDPRTCVSTCLRAWLVERGNLPRSSRVSRQPSRRAGTRESDRLFTRLDRGGIGLAMDAEAVAKIVKRCVELIGLDPKLYGAHSLRAGFVTEAAERGVSDTLIASHTGHRSVQSLRFYFRRRRLWSGNAAMMLGL
jgi:integrase